MRSTVGRAPSQHRHGRRCSTVRKLQFLPSLPDDRDDHLPSPRQPFDGLEIGQADVRGSEAFVRGIDEGGWQREIGPRWVREKLQLSPREELAQ